MNLYRQVRDLESELDDLKEVVMNQKDEDYAGQLEFVRNRIQRIEQELLPKMRAGIERNRALIWSYGIGLLMTFLGLLVRWVS